MAAFRRVFRLLLVVLLFLFGIVWIGLPVMVQRCVPITVTSMLAKGAFRTWCAITCYALNVHIETFGQRDQQAALIVSNHVSWLDILVIASVCDTHFVSKSEVAKWPVIGVMAKGLGTLFIQRGGGQGAGQTTSSVKDYLLQRKTVLFFPEGTTTRGDVVRKFHARIYKAAVEAKADVQPLALRYLENGMLSSIVPYIDDDTLVMNLWQLLAVKRVDCHVSFCQPVKAEQMSESRDEFARQTRLQVCAALGLDESEIK